MVRTKLINLLNQEISRYLSLPYYSNLPPKTGLQTNAAVGKGNWQQIKSYTSQLANKQGVNLSGFTTFQIRQFQSKNKIGIDCSGLAYHLSSFWFHLLTGKSLKSFLTGTENRTGPRRINAHLLTSPPNAFSVYWPKLQTGDLIRFSSGHHVGFIISTNQNQIDYINSSRYSSPPGVCQRKITPTDPQIEGFFRLSVYR